jgi:hypothetical protein
VLSSGPFFGGTSSLAWDGKDGAGNRLRPGTYFLRLESPFGARAIRFVAL